MCEGFVRGVGEVGERNIDFVGFDVVGFEIFFTSFGNFWGWGIRKETKKKKKRKEKKRKEKKKNKKRKGKEKRKEKKRKENKPFSQ